MPGYKEGDVDLPPSNIDPNLYPNDPNFGATAPSGTSGSGDVGNPGASVQINPSQQQQQLQLINQLGYNPSYPYGSFGSGVPQIPLGPDWLRFIPYLGQARTAAQLINTGIRGGTYLGNKLFGGKGGGGSGGGGDGGDTSEGVTVGDPQVVEWAGGGDKTGGGGGFNFGNMFSGLPEGFSESNRFGEGAPSFTGPGASQSNWTGGSAFGGRVGNFATAIGFGGNLGGGGATGGYSNSLGRLQMMHALKGVGTGLGAGSGYSPLYSLTGTAAPSAGQLQQSQADLGNILRTNPQLLFGPTSGGVPRGTPMKQVT